VATASPIDVGRAFPAVVHDQPRIIYASHFKTRGIDLFNAVCQLDLEGIVCKHKLAPYGCERVPWFKMLNPNYSQREGRLETFERRRIPDPRTSRAHVASK
jgi:hypothetical protein